MYCRICGKEIPDDSRFCPHCGREVVAAAPDKPTTPAGPHGTGGTKRFTFSPDTTYDQAANAVNDWLAQRQIRLLGADFQLDAALLAGSIMPLVQQVDLDWMEEPGAAPYRMAVMLDSRTDFGLGRKQGSRTLHRQYDHWREEHPEYEIAAKQEKELSLGWTSGWATLFFYR